MPRDSEEQRQKLFRRMEWVYVYAPPLLAVMVAAGGGYLLAIFVPIPDTSFAQRWGMAVGLILGLPLLAYFVMRWLER